MTFLELQNLCLLRLGEKAYLNTETGEPTVAALDEVKVEVNAGYVEAVNLLAEHHVYAVANEDDVTFAVGTREVDLDVDGESAVLAARARKILSVAVYPNADITRDPIPATFPFRGSVNRRHRRYGGMTRAYAQLHNYGSQHEMYFRGRYLGFYVTPTQQQIVQVVSAPVVETLSADGDIPAQVPVEHHPYIAQHAAVMLAGSESSTDSLLLLTLARLEERLRNVAPNYNEYSPNVPGSWGGR